MLVRHGSPQVEPARAPERPRGARQQTSGSKGPGPAAGGHAPTSQDDRVGGCDVGYGLSRRGPGLVAVGELDRRGHPDPLEQRDLVVAGLADPNSHLRLQLRPGRAPRGENPVPPLPADAPSVPDTAVPPAAPAIPRARRSDIPLPSFSAPFYGDSGTGQGGGEVVLDRERVGPACREWRVRHGRTRFWYGSEEPRDASKGAWTSNQTSNIAVKGNSIISSLRVSWRKQGYDGSACTLFLLSQ